MPGEGPADGSEAIGLRTVDTGRCRGFGETVTLEHDDADGIEPLRDLPIQRCRRRDEEAQPTAEPLPDGGEHQPVGDLVAQRIQPRRFLACLFRLRYPQPDIHRPVEDPLLQPALLGHHALDPRAGFLEDARSRTHEGGMHHGDVLDDLVDPAVDGGGEADLQRQCQHHLAEGVGQGQPQIIQVVRTEDVKSIDGGRGIRPCRMGQDHTFRLTRGAGRVDDARHVFGTDRIRALGHDVGGLCDKPPAALLDVGKRQHPVAVALAVDDHHRADAGQLGAMLSELVDLGLVLGEHDAAARVRHDESDVGGLRGGVDRGRRSPGAHHGEVDEHPFVSRRHRHRDRVFRFDTKRDQPGGEYTDPLTHLPPGDTHPAATGQEPEGLRLRGWCRHDRGRGGQPTGLDGRSSLDRRLRPRGSAQPYTQSRGLMRLRRLPTRPVDAFLVDGPVSDSGHTRPTSRRCGVGVRNEVGRSTRRHHRRQRCSPEVSRSGNDITATFPCCPPTTQLRNEAPVTYYVFDVLALDGKSTTGLPHLRRRTELDDLALSGPRLQVPPYWTDVDGEQMLDLARRHHPEGAVA